MKQIDNGLIEYLNEEADKIKKHGCIVPRVEMGTKDFLKTIELINRQKAEINILVRKHDILLDEIAEKDAEIEEKSNKLREILPIVAELKTEAIKEFAERLKHRYRVVEISSGGFIPAVIRKDIDNLVKEMTEGL